MAKAFAISREHVVAVGDVSPQTKKLTIALDDGIEANLQAAHQAITRLVEHAARRMNTHPVGHYSRVTRGIGFGWPCISTGYADLATIEGLDETMQATACRYGWTIVTAAMVAHGEGSLEPT